MRERKREREKEREKGKEKENKKERESVQTLTPGSKTVETARPSQSPQDSIFSGSNITGSHLYKTAEREDTVTAMPTKSCLFLFKGKRTQQHAPSGPLLIGNLPQIVSPRHIRAQYKSPLF